ncbi:unnamed protein product [Cochlearia groenlandica]
MLDQIDHQATDSPSRMDMANLDSVADESNGLSLKKRSSEENKPPGSRNMLYDAFFNQKRNLSLHELQHKAYFDVLQAFIFESHEMSTGKVTIIKELKKQWNITNKTHKGYANKVKARMAQSMNEEDLDKFKDKTKPTSVIEDSAILTWGEVSPESLVNKWIKIILPGEVDYIAYLIEDYDPKKDMHYLVTHASKSRFQDPCNWIDIRYFPAEDTVWQDGHPGFPTRKCFLKPGDSILRATSTAQRKKKANEVGETACGIPIFSKLDEGKPIA